MEQNSIVVKNVTKKFDDFMLDHISFTVPTGRIVGFIGENGAGKSTTINLILDQLKLDAGEIRILGKQNHSYLHKENIGVVFDLEWLPAWVPFFWQAVQKERDLLFRIPLS